jgi:hypothetical protein
MINGERAAVGPIDSRLIHSSEGTNSWTLLPAQASLFEAAAALSGGASWRLVDTDGNLAPSRNNVASASDVNGNVVTFSADAPDRFTGDYGILVNNGAVGGLNAGTLAAGANTWTLPTGRAELLWDSSSSTGRTFRIMRPNGTFLSSTNTVTSVTPIDASTSEVEFTSDAAISCYPPFRIMIPNGTVGAVNTQGSPGSSALYLTPERASMLSLGQTFKFAASGPGGTLRLTEYTVGTVSSAGKVSFSPPLAATYYPKDFLVITSSPPLPVYVTMDGHVDWSKSLAGGADTTNIGDASLFDSSKTAAGVFSGTGAFAQTGAAGQYRVIDGSLVGASTYPANDTDLVAQMFGRYGGKGGTGNSMGTALGLLYTWGVSGPLAKRTVDEFLGLDNKGQKGDQRAQWDDGTSGPRGGGSTVGAYQ